MPTVGVREGVREKNLVQEGVFVSLRTPAIDWFCYVLFDTLCGTIFYIKYSKNTFFNIQVKLS